ncbi:MAG: hypothetical protein HOC08_09370, partial [Deltaproteobacteria bacterium]|nr:hypothetical protein [Deltaproteobacteria bacterium]
AGQSPRRSRWITSDLLPNAPVGVRTHGEGARSQSSKKSWRVVSTSRPVMGGTLKNSSITASVMPQALSSFVEKIARSLEIQDNLQLNVLTNVQKGTEGVKVGLDRLKLDHLMSMLYQLENHRPVLRTTHLSISISPGNRQVRASFQVHKQLGG